jgi:outer membrane protein insertion porin family
MLRTTRLGALACLLVAATAAAGCKEEKGGVKVSSFTFAGVKAVSPKQLKSVLATAASDKIPWGTKRYFNRDQFEADLKRIEAFYTDRGYPDARVESFDVKLSEDQTSVKIHINVREGEPIRVERVALEGFEGLPQQHRRELEARMPLKPGAPLDRAFLQASREAALDELKDHGFPYATVRLTEDVTSARSRAITLRAEPGPLAHFGPIDISGNIHVGDRIVRRQLTYRPGQLFQQSKILESQRSLYGVELFDFANVEPLPVGDQATAQPPVLVPTRVTITEGKHKRVTFGLGYGTEEKARAQVDWRHVNFFGGARTFGVLGRYSSLDRGVRLNFTEPYFFTRRYTFGLSAQNWFSDEPAFKLTTVGGRATITRRFARGIRPALAANDSTSLSFTYTNEWEDYSISEDTLNDPTQRDELIALGLDPRTGSDTGRLSSISLDGGRNTTGNVLDARHGYVAIAHLEQAGGWLGGDFDFREMTLEGRYYITVADTAVIAVRARGGSINASGDPENVVPFFKRYFLGGSTNLRGWGRFEVAPLSEGEPIGGLTTLNFSTELRVPVWRNLSGVLFLDGGNVWENSWDFNVNDLRYDVGPGLRYKTPVGPFRLDFAYQLNQIPGLLVNGEPEKRHWRIHFSIGQAF